MRLEQLTPAHVRRAIAIYNRYAWPSDEGGKPRYTAEALAGEATLEALLEHFENCLLYTSPSPRDQRGSRMPSSA